jgi:hypothetical protein
MSFGIRMNEANQELERKAISIAASAALLVGIGLVINRTTIGPLELDGWFKLWIVVVLVWFAQRSNVVLIGVIVLASLIMREPRGFRSASMVQSILYTIMSLGLLYWTACYEGIRQAFIHWLLRTLGSAKQHQGVDSADLPGNQRSWVQSRGMYLGGVWIGSSLLATMLFSHQPLVGNDVSWFMWTTQSGQVLWPGPLFIVGIIGLFVAIHESGRRFKTFQQGRMELRSILVANQFADLRRIARYRIKRAQKNENRKLAKVSKQELRQGS